MSWNWISSLEAHRREGRPVAAVTVTQCTGSTPRETGAKMLVLADDRGVRIEGTIGGGHLEQLAIEDARKALADGKALAIRYPLGAKTGQCCGGVVELLIEPLNIGPRLYLFGAGHVGQAICRTLDGTPFTVHLIDEREEWVNSPQLPASVVQHRAGWDEFVGDASWDDRRTYAAVMTFRHDMDERIVEEILRKKLAHRYLGLIGSNAKWGRFKQRLSARGLSMDELERVRCPIGMDLGGGKAPAEIAVSVAAELLKHHYADCALQAPGATA